MGIRLGGRRGPRIRSVIGVLAPLALLLCVIGAFLVYRDFNSCMSASEDALTEFPHYEDARIDPGPNMAANEEQCGGSLTTTDDAEQVFAYYRQQLAANGWSVSEGHSERNEDMEYRTLRGERGELCYLVGVQHYFNATSDEKQVSVVVDRAGSCR